MTTKKFSHITVIALAVLSALVLATFYQRHEVKVRAQASAFALVPSYQIWYTRTGSSSNDANAAPLTSTYYNGQDSAGDHVYSRSDSTALEITIPSQGLIVLYYADQNLKSTLRYTGKAVPPDRHASGCTDMPGLTGESSTMLGFNVVHAVSGDPKAEGQSDQWLAPALNCEPLEETYTYATGQSVTTATQATTTPPAQSMFVIPVSAAETMPSVLFGQAGLPATTNLDAGYQKQLTQQPAQ